MAAEAAAFVGAIQPGEVRALAGATLDALIAAFDEIDDGRRFLGFRLAPAGDVDGYLEQVVDALAVAAARIWPLWWGEPRTLERDDPLGGRAAELVAQAAARAHRGVSAAWAEAAIRLVLRGRLPRLPGADRMNEAAQLARLLSPSGLALIADVSGAAGGGRDDALAHALEASARRLGASVAALFGELPPMAPPLDRILYEARDFSRPPAPRPPPEPEIWLAPWRGAPHPMSDAEQRLAAAIAAEPELSPLFEFNRMLTTTRGSTPKVDLVWRAGRLVVEIDGYHRHGNRISFSVDRHRDFELLLSGFTVLRLTNDEIEDDLERAVAKIRDLVRLRRGEVEGR